MIIRISFQLSLLLTIGFVLVACSINPNQAKSKVEAILQSKVSAAFETRALPKDSPQGFDADDPAIWVNPNNVDESLVVGTLKRGGLDVYNLKGELVQHIPPVASPACVDKKNCNNKGGRWNNADVIYDFPLNSGTVDLILASDRGTDKVDIFRVEFDSLSDKQEGRLVNITSPTAPRIFSETQDEVNQGNTAYGLAAVHLKDELGSKVFVTQNATTSVAVLTLTATGNDQISYTIDHVLDFPREFKTSNNEPWKPCSDSNDELPHFEGIVVDEFYGWVYLAQEDVGIWRISLNAPENKDRWQLIHKVNSFGVPYARDWSEAEDEFVCKLDLPTSEGDADTKLMADVEGLSLYTKPNGGGYLFVSSQGNNQFAVYERGSEKYLGSFMVEADIVDGVYETDGFMVVSEPLGNIFPNGLMVTQDGENQNQAQIESTNFKYIDLGLIRKEIELLEE